MTYPEAVSYLETFTNYERTHHPAKMRAVRLERMRLFCDQLGRPQSKFRSVLVAGTNAKGSIATILYAMLRAGSFRVGLYTSPHLEVFRERIRVGETAKDPIADSALEWISETDWTALVEEFRPILESWRPRGLTYFEIVTALAFVYFSRRQVELAVVEVGMGGRLDATNILEPTVSIFGPIDMDHADILGSNPVLIAKEKAGIIKPGQTVVTVSQPAEIIEVLRAVCLEQGATLVVCGQDVRVTVQDHSPNGLQMTVLGLRGMYKDLEFPLIGRHQADNALAAITALEVLSDTGIPYRLVERGLAFLEWPGRLEIVSHTPIVVLDGAHNAQAARALRDTLEALWPKRRVHLLVGMFKDKAVEAVAEILGPRASSVTCSRIRHPRAMDTQTLVTLWRSHCRKTHAIQDPVDGYTVLLNSVDPKDLIVVTGSLIFVGEVRTLLRQSAAKIQRRAFKPSVQRVA